MPKKTRTITVISATIIGATKYVTAAKKRHDGQYLVELTSNLRDAKEFTDKEARDVCPRIFNPHHRDYVVEETLVDWSKSKMSTISGNLK